jgi:hypothetical protein
MRVRRTACASFVTALAAGGLLVLAGPALAETPDPTPASSDDGGVVDPAGNPDCFLVTPSPDSTDEPTAEPSDQPSDEPTDEPTGEVTAEPGATITPEPGTTDEATPDVTDEPTDGATDEPTSEPTSDPTDEPTDGPTVDATPTPYYVCLAYTGPLAGGVPPTQGGGAPQLPFSGAPVGRYAETGLALLLAGTGTVLLAARRRSS